MVRFFGEFSINQTTLVLGVSDLTAEQSWAFARGSKKRMSRVQRRLRPPVNR